ncbi:MAG: TraR/DksA family transcriptional regulator [Acidimicrobiales bacterium]
MRQAAGVEPASAPGGGSAKAPAAKAAGRSKAAKAAKSVKPTEGPAAEAPREGPAKPAKLAKSAKPARARTAAPAKSARATKPAASSKPAAAPKAAKRPPAARRSAPATAARSNGAAPGPAADQVEFLAAQAALLSAERFTYEEQANALRAEADSLVQEMEPGDVQFDEESGEGGTVTVDRERDLALSAQALAAIEEIDHALAKIDAGTYGLCERCHQPIPRPRLEVVPYARLCVPCKSGGLSRR